MSPQARRQLMNSKAQVIFCLSPLFDQAWLKSAVCESLLPVELKIGFSPLAAPLQGSVEMTGTLYHLQVSM